VAAFRSVWARGGARVHSFGNPYGEEFVMHLVAAVGSRIRFGYGAAIAAGVIASACGATPLEPRSTVPARNQAPASAPGTAPAAETAAVGGTVKSKPVVAGPVVPWY
jgi:hypothetical protein